MFDFMQNTVHTFSMIWWLIVPMAMAQPVSNPKLSCVLDKLEVCADADFKLAPIESSHFSKVFDGRKEAFTDWIKPMALYIQGLTGMPASIFIAQAAAGSDWGTTAAFREQNNIFKQICWQVGSVITGEFDLSKHHFKYRGVCQKDKVIGQVGKFIKFASREESVSAYLHFTVAMNTRYSKAFNEDLRHGEKFTPPRPSSFRSASPLLSYFAVDNGYVAGIQRAIQGEKLTTFDVPACWQCLLMAARPPVAAEPAAAPAPAAPGAPVTPPPAPVPAPPASAPPATGGTGK